MRRFISTAVHKASGGRAGALNNTAGVSQGLRSRAVWNHHRLLALTTSHANGLGVQPFSSGANFDNSSRSPVRRFSLNAHPVVKSPELYVQTGGGRGYDSSRSHLIRYHGSARPFSSGSGKDEEKEKSKDEGGAEKGGGCFFSTFLKEIQDELEKNDELKENLGKLKGMKEDAVKSAEEAKESSKVEERSDAVKEEAKKKLDEATEEAKRRSEELYNTAKSAQELFEEKWGNVSQTVRDKTEKLEKDSEFYRSAKERAKKAQDAASEGAEKLGEDSRFRRISKTTSSLFKEAKDDLFGADAETRKERRDQTKRIRERKAERIAARNEAIAAKRAAELEAEVGGEGYDQEKDEGGMKSDWAEAIDEESGDPYYYNVKTGETTWEKPVGFGGVEGAEETEETERLAAGEGEGGAEEKDGGAEEQYPTISESEARAYFDGFDRDGEGVIGEEDFDELVDIIAENRPEVCIPQTRAEVLAALERMDPDAKGEVHADAYLDWIDAYTSSGGQSHGEVTGGAIILRGDVETAWQRAGERLRSTPLIQDILGASEYAGRQFDETDMGQRTRNVRDRVSNLREDALETWETSQNPWVYRFASAYDGLTAETEQGQAIRELKRLDPGWDLLDWFEEVQDEIAPAVLRGYLEGDDEMIDFYCFEQAGAVIKAATKENKLNGKIPDPTILDCRGVELLAARVLQKAPPILVVKFQTQQIKCVRNNKGEVIEGSEDQVEAVFYYMAVQRNWDEEAEELRWHVLEFQLVGKLDWH
jgi:hypothetical protein